MIKTKEQAIAVQKRRERAGRKGKAKAVRRFEIWLTRNSGMPRRRV